MTSQIPPNSTQRPAPRTTIQLKRRPFWPHCLEPETRCSTRPGCCVPPEIADVPVATGGSEDTVLEAAVDFVGFVVLGRLLDLDCRSSAVEERGEERLDSVVDLDFA